MEIALCIVLVSVIIGFFILKNKESKIDNLNLKEIVKQTFPKYKIIEKHGTIMICEISHRNEPEELVFIRINSSKNKTIKKSGRILIADYPDKPTKKQLKEDFERHLQ